MTVSTENIKLLRETTGAGVLDCKKALEETGGDMDKAVELLRKKGLAAAEKKSSREAKDGLVSAHLSPDGKVGVLVEVNCETDFVARTDDFQRFVTALVRQVASQPNLTSPEALLAAPFVDNPSKTVSEQLTETIAKLGENIVIQHVARFDKESGGMLDNYVHFGGRVGVLVDVVGSTPDNSKFAELVHNIALHVAGAAPRYLTKEDVPPEAMKTEENINELVLLEQPFIKDSSMTIAQLLQKYSKELGNELKVRRFARFELGAS